MHRTKRLIMLLGCLAAVTGIWVVIWFQSGHDRKQVQKTTEETTSNLARAFEEHVLSTVRQIDSMLLVLRDEYQNNPERFREQLALSRKRMLDDVIIQTSVIDASGFLIFSEQPLPAVPLYLGDREHFRVHRDGGNDFLFISKPVLGRVSKKWSIQFTRRISNRDGTFGGVLVISVDPEYFASFYRPVELGRKGAVTLVGTDRVIRARSVSENRPNATGQTLPANRPLFDPTKPAVGVFHFAGTTDGIERTWAYRRLHDYPLIVVVGFADDEVFRPVYDRRNMLALWGVILSALVLAGNGMILWFDQRQRKTEHELRDTMRRLELAASSGRMGIWDWDIRNDVLLWDGRMFELFGISPSAFSGRADAFHGLLHPDDLAATKSAIGAAIKDEKDYDVDYRIVHPDGSVKILKANGIVLRDKDGIATRMIGISYDITARRMLKNELRSKVAQLEAALAKVKQLEGIIPICTYCKKIRDDKESWQLLETYISDHSEAMFSHGICPECFAIKSAEFEGK